MKKCEYLKYILRGIGRPYVKSRDNQSDLPPDPPPPTPPPPYGSNWGHEIADFVFLPYISFILAFRGIWKPYVKSLYSWSDLPPDPPFWVKLGS